MNPSDEERLLAGMEGEAALAGDWKIQLELDLTSALALCANLQLALRHPLNAGPSSKIARQIIDDFYLGLKERGFTAHAEALQAGDDPSYDYDPREATRKPRLAIVRSATFYPHETETE
jgi:hypothetical protein